MIQDIAIQHETNGRRGRYFARLETGETAEMTYIVHEPGLREFNHTLVPDAFRGRGIALKLVERGIKAARTENFKIIPTCSYVATQFRRHSDWTDLLA